MAKAKSEVDAIIDDYEKKQGDILYRMYKIVLRAQKMAEQKEYASILKKLKNE